MKFPQNFLVSLLNGKPPLGYILCTKGGGKSVLRQFKIAFSTHSQPLHYSRWHTTATTTAVLVRYTRRTRVHGSSCPPIVKKILKSAQRPYSACGERQVMNTIRFRGMRVTCGRGMRALSDSIRATTNAPNRQVTGLFRNAFPRDRRSVVPTMERLTFK